MMRAGLDQEGKLRTMVDFQCTVQAGQVSEDMRGILAQAIERACHEVLGSEPGSELPVTVEWIEIPRGFAFRGGQPSTTSLVRGKIPDGCDRETRSRLLMTIGDEWCRISGSGQDEVIVSARDRGWSG